MKNRPKHDLYRELNLHDPLIQAAYPHLRLKSSQQPRSVITWEHIIRDLGDLTDLVAHMHSQGWSELELIERRREQPLNFSKIFVYKQDQSTPTVHYTRTNNSIPDSIPYDERSLYLLQYDLADLFRLRHGVLIRRECLKYLIVDLICEINNV